MDSQSGLTEQSHPSILVQNYRLKYGFVQLTHNHVYFLDFVNQDHRLSQLSLHNIESLNISTLNVTKLQIIREAAQEFETDDFDQPMSTFSQSLTLTPQTQEKYFDCKKLLVFGQNLVETLNCLSGKQGNNGLELIDENGIMMTIISLPLVIRQMANFIFDIIQYNKVFQQANRLLPYITWQYQMSKASINFALKIPISVQDYKFLNYDYCIQAQNNSKMMKNVDSAIDNLMNCILGNIRRQSSDFKQLFTNKQSKIVQSFEEYQSVYSFLPDDFYNNNIQIIFNFQNGQAITRLLNNLPETKQTYTIGVAAFLNADYKRASINCNAEFKDQLLLILLTDRLEKLLLLFQSLSKNIPNQVTSLKIVNLESKQSEDYNDCKVSLSQECIQCLDMDNKLIFNLCKDLSEIVSGSEWFLGKQRSTQYVVSIRQLEAWKFIV